MSAYQKSRYTLAGILFILVAAYALLNAPTWLLAAHSGEAASDVTMAPWARQEGTETPLPISSTLTLTATLVVPPPTLTPTPTITSTVEFITPTPTASPTDTSTPTVTQTIAPSLTPTSSPPPDTTYTIHLPKILKEVWSPDMRGIRGRLYTSYSITNLETCSACMALVTADYYDLTGRLVTTEIINVLPGDVIIVHQKSNRLLPEGIYSAVIRANQPIAVLVGEALLNPQLFTPPFAFPFSMYTGLASGSTQVALPHLLYNWFDSNSAAYIQNTSDTTAHITINFVPHVSDGMPIGPATPPILTYTLMPYTSTVLDVRTLATLAAPLGQYEGRFMGAAFITSDQPLAAVVTDSDFVSYAQSSYQGFSDNDMGVDLLAPRIMFAYESAFASVNVYNPSIDQTVAVTITYTADATSRAYSGDPVEGRQVEVAFMVEPRSINVRYLGNASVGDLYRDFSRFRGTARIKASRPIAGWVTQSVINFGTASTPLNAYHSPPMSRLSTGVRLPVIQTEENRDYTIITCANSSATQSAPIRIWYHSDAYSIPPSASFYFDHVIPPGGSLTRDESTRDSPFADLNVNMRSNRFYGTAYITSLHNIPIVCIVNQVARFGALDRTNIYTGIGVAPYAIPSPTPTRTATPTATGTATPTATATPIGHIRLPLVMRGRELFRWVWRPWPLPEACCEGLYGIAMVSDTDGWAVGHGGVILRWDGSAWTLWPSPTTKQLHAVSMVSPTDGWAVGADGEMLRWNGQAWTRVTSPTQATLHSVAMLTSDDGWAVGDMGTILRWNGQTWANVPSPTETTLRSISMVSQADGWAVSDNGTILRWDNNMWSIITRARAGLRSVSMRSATEGWAVGGIYSYSDGCSPRGCDYYVSYGVIMRWNGRSWTEMSNPLTIWMSAVLTVSPTEAWAVGEGGNSIRWDGRAWKPIMRQTDYGLYGVAATPDGAIWAVGAPGVILRAALERVPWPE